MEKNHHSHDRLFRHAMSLPLVARQFLETWMPKEFLNLVEWSTLRVEKISGISEPLMERREDILYRIDIAGRAACFYLLFEHQSRPLRIMPLRVFEYTGLIWQNHRGDIESGRNLPLVIPIVIYPGPGKWSASRRLRDLIETPAQISQWAEGFVPDCGFLVIELAGLPMEKLADGRLARAVLAALQNERAGRMNFAEVQRIVAEIFAEPERREALAIANHLWSYLLHHSELQSREVSEIVNSTIPTEQKENFMSTAETLRQEGRQEGQIIAHQQAVLEALEIRFERVPEGLRDEIEIIRDPRRLHVLHRAAISCADLESFAKEL
ncbi:MAG: Rpn family recombination-promoting nuclease/putative transposase [Spartobacteria bacterium]